MFSTTSSKAPMRLSLLMALLLVVFQSIAATRLPRDEKFALEHSELPIPLTRMLPVVPHDDIIELATPQSLTPPLKAYQSNRRAATLIVDKVFLQRVNNAKSLFDGRLQGVKNAKDRVGRFRDKIDPFFADHHINADHREPPKQSELPLLNDITFSARSGEITAIMGPSGFGKTTLLNVIGHRLEQESGNVTVNGSPHYSAYYMTQGAKDLDREQTIFTAVDNARRNAYPFFPYFDLISLIHQFFSELNDPDSPRKTTDALLRSVGLWEHRYRRIGTHAKDLISGGQMIRVAIAQALATNRRVLLLDEPLTGLSSQDIQLVMRSIKRVAKEDNLIVLMTLHDPSQEVVDEIDKFFFFSAAGPLFSGSQEEMIAHLEAFKNHLELANPPVNPAFIHALFKPNAICTTVMSHIASPDYITGVDAPLYTKETARAQNVYDMEEDNGLDVSIGPYLAHSARPMYQPEDVTELMDSFDGLEQAHEDGRVVFSGDKLLRLYNRFNEAYSTSAEGYKEARKVNLSVMTLAMICFPLMKHNLEHRIAFASLIYYMMITATITQILTVQPFLNYRRAAMEEIKNGQYSKLEFSLAMDAVIIQKEVLFTALFMIPVFLFSGLPRDIGTVAISFVALFGMKLCTYAANKVILQHSNGPTVLLAGATTLLQLFQTYSGFLNPSMSPVINWFLHINYLAHGLRAMMNRNLERMVFTGAIASEDVPGASVLDLYRADEKLSVSMAYLFGSLFVMYSAALLMSSGSIKEWPLLRRPQPKREEPAVHGMASELPSPSFDWKDPIVEERLTPVRPSYFRRHRVGRLFSSPTEEPHVERGPDNY